MRKTVIDFEPGLVGPSKNFSPEKDSLETGWPSKWYSPVVDQEDGLLPALGRLDGLLLPAVQQAEDAPLLVKFIDPPTLEELALKLPALEGVSLLQPPGADENGPPLMLKIEGVENESVGAWVGLSDLIEGLDEFVEDSTNGVGLGESHKLDGNFIEIGDAIKDEELLPEWDDVLNNLDPEGLLLPAINGQDSLLFVKVELSEDSLDLSALRETQSLDDLQILQAGKSGIFGFAEALKVEWTPIDDFELKLEDDGGGGVGEQLFDIVG